MKSTLRSLVFLGLLLFPCGPTGADGDGTRPKIRLADVGWTDITATTAVVAELLGSMGFDPEIRMLSLPVTFSSLKNGDVDVFLGNWMPTMANDIKPYIEEDSITDLSVNLTGALYTMAVPRYVYQTGVTSAEHLAAHREKFKGRIYGIEPGNEGNRFILKMISENTYGLAGWTLVESSEQGMLTEVKQAMQRGEWIAFLGWQPHPMNTQLEIEYLKDPLQQWPGGGVSEVHTIISKKLGRDLPHVVRFLRNVKFTVDIENELMNAILIEGKAPDVVARSWIESHPEIVNSWLEGVSLTRIAARETKKEDWTRQRKIPLGRWISDCVNYLTANFSSDLRGGSGNITQFIESIVGVLARVPPHLTILFLVLLTLFIHRSFRLATAVLLGCMLIWNLGYWIPTVQTLGLVITACFISMIIGVPIGIAAARRPWLFAVIRPCLDMMQTIPTFVYLIPTLMLFGLGIVPGLISTVIFALPAPIRLTYLGLTSVPKDIIEAAEAFGARPIQVLTKVEIPHALPTILEGVTQALMLSLSMVVIAALVGAEGLGTPVVRALNTVNVEQGFEAGLSIVIVAILLDRVVKKQPAPKRRRRFGETGL